MEQIALTTYIKAPLEKCFNLSRNIDLHIQSMKRSSEKAVAGKTKGLIGLNETVTWRARHLGIWWTLTSKITGFEQNKFFTDEMLSGPFKYLKHVHSFDEKNGLTTMRDDFRFSSPFWILGTLADKLVLKKYLTRLLENRNALIKAVAEKSSSGNFD